MEPKITITWDGDEGLASKSDRRKILEMAADPTHRIAVLDFLMDVQYEAEKLYAECINLPVGTRYFWLGSQADA